MISVPPHRSLHSFLLTKHSEIETRFFIFYVQESRGLSDCNWACLKGEGREEETEGRKKGRDSRREGRKKERSFFWTRKNIEIGELFAFSLSSLPGGVHPLRTDQPYNVLDSTINGVAYLFFSLFRVQIEG